MEMFGGTRRARRWPSSTTRTRPMRSTKALTRRAPALPRTSCAWCSAAAATAMPGKRPLMGTDRRRAGGRHRSSPTTTRAPRIRRGSSPTSSRGIVAGARSPLRRRARPGASRSAPLCGASRARATSCSSPARATRTTRSTGRSAARSATRRWFADVLSRSASMKRTLADFAHACGGRLEGADAASRRLERHAHAQARASCSSPCAVRDFNGNEFVERGAGGRRCGRRRRLPRSRWRSRRSWCSDTQAALERRGAQLARGSSPFRWSASPAATARPPPRR